MTLEDFFTLTEMKDGLTAPSRVQELVSVMQKEQDCEVKNTGDAIRQWAAVASTVAATENKDCLDLFIQLDGLCFINRWLKDAQNFGVDANDSFIEESITTMLRAVEKLHLDSEMSISSGIRITVSNLLHHHSTRVQDRARVLFDSWKGGGNGDGDTESHDVELAKVDNGSDKVVREEGQPSALNEDGNGNDHASDNLTIQSSDKVLQSSASVECEDIKDGLVNHLASVPSSAPEIAPIHEGLPLCAAGETTLVGTCNFSVPNQGNFEGQPDLVQLNDLAKKENQEQNVNDPSEKLGAPEICSASSKLEPEPVSMVASEAKASESVKEPAVVENNKDVCHKIITSVSMRTPASDRRSEADDIGAVTSITQLSKAAENDDDCCSNALQDRSVSDSNLGKTEVLDMSVSGTEYIRPSNEGKGHGYNDGEDTSEGSDSSKPGTDFRSPNIIDKRVSDNELDFGIVDALEVARQVAQEVNREVCSSSDKTSEGGIKQPGSPDSVRKEDKLSLIPPEEVSSRQSDTAGACSEEGHASISDNTEAEPECRPDVVSLQVSEMAHDSGSNLEKKRLCAFDLNEAGFDDMDLSVNTTSSPIPVISASRPAPTPGLPGAPLQFEGTLGWRGSAATSAFRPASPRKSCDNERNLSVDRNSDNLKPRQDWLDIDLNVSEGEEGMVKPIAESSGLPSWQSSIELSSKRSSRLELDLNSTGDEGDAPSDHKMEGQLFLGRNGYWSPSPASSSSSMQPAVRNIDLNDRPCLQTDLVEQGPGKSSHIVDAYGHSKSTDAPIISILGAKVEVGKKEYGPSLSLRNGNTTEPAMELTVSRAGGISGIGPSVSFNHSSVFGYNGVASAPAMPTLSFSSAIYGSVATIPYMVDSRGAPVIPQVGVSSSTVLPSYSQPPIIMNVTGAQLGLNGFGPSRPIDLNSGFVVEGGNRDTSVTRQFFFPGQGRTMEEHVRTMPQPSSSGVGGKRKEPDSGWESYPFSYKHPQPPWK